MEVVVVVEVMEVVVVVEVMEVVVVGGDGGGGAVNALHVPHCQPAPHIPWFIPVACLPYLSLPSLLAPDKPTLVAYRLK